MQDIGVWTTANGTSEAHLDMESGDDVTATELPGWVSDVVKGAVAGAVTGAPGGIPGAVVGAVAGGALGGASSVSKPAATGTSQAADANKAKIAQALQQFAAIVPALVQLVAASGKKEISDAGENFESTDGSDWGPESFEGTWTQP